VNVSKPKLRSEKFDDDDDDDNNNNNAGNRNVMKKEAERILKYKDLTIETGRIWNVKRKVIMVLIGKTGTISKSLGQYLSNIPGQHDINELQKIQPCFTLHT